MKKILTIAFILTIHFLHSQDNLVQVVSGDHGYRLQIDSSDFFIKGMNWDYFPIGTNYEYNIWAQPDEFIAKALDYEMTLLQEMGVNTIRQYNRIPPRWIQYIYEKYGIYTMLNHTFGRYGVMLPSGWQDHTDYADPEVRSTLLSEIELMTNQYRNTPGLLLYLIGNENNYGLFWEGSETEDFPTESSVYSNQPKAMYKLLDDAAAVIKTLDTNHPVALCNGDLQFLDVIAEQCTHFDIFGTNSYRGESFGDLFERVDQMLDMPVVLTEFGSDALHAATLQECESEQAYYLLGNWKEIYENASRMGKASNSLGGFTFQFSDGWWKHGQSTNLDIHDTNASWQNGGYEFDYEEGINNMNEEWFGICAKNDPDASGLYTLRPRNAYHLLKKIHAFDPSDPAITLQEIEELFQQMGSDEF